MPKLSEYRGFEVVMNIYHTHAPTNLCLTRSALEHLGRLKRQINLVRREFKALRCGFGSGMGRVAEDSSMSILNEGNRPIQDNSILDNLWVSLVILSIRDR